MPTRTDGKSQQKGYALVCEICGKEFSGKGPNARRCPDCSDAYMRIRWKIHGRNERRGIRCSYATAGEEALAIMREALEKGEPFPVEQRKKAATKPVAEIPVETHPCPYCGREIHGEAAYCAKCVNEGLDNLHRVTGRTNGWDRAAPAKPRRSVRRRSGYAPVPSSYRQSGTRKTA